MELFLSVVIPAFNEASSISVTLRSVLDYLSRSWAGEWEVLVVDDGSTDATVALVRQVADPRVRLITFGKNQGKGRAMAAGARQARGAMLLFMDADSSTEITELGRFASLLDRADIVFGSRAMAGSAITAAQPWYREASGKLGNWLIRALLLPGVKDTQCGFKLLGPAAVPLARQLCTRRWAVDVELLAAAKRQGLRIWEEPVQWKHEPTSAVHFASYLQTLLEVLALTWRFRSRKPYERNRN